jgi:stage II sporulation protein M
MENEPKASGARPWSWREQRRYFRELRPYFFTSIALMIAGALGGAATSAYAPEFSSAGRETLRQFVRLFAGLPKPNLALAIFFNNGVKTLLVIVVGTLGGILPLVFLLVNGYVLGLLAHDAMRSGRLPIFILSIAPHGALEIPTVLLGTSVGLRLGVHAIRRAFGKPDGTVTGELARALRFFITVIAPLLVLAALIEAFITTLLAR